MGSEKVKIVKIGHFKIHKSGQEGKMTKGSIHGNWGEGTLRNTREMNLIIHCFSLTVTDEGELMVTLSICASVTRVC